MLFDKRPQRIRRLLIVEDEALIAFDNEHALTEAGYQIVATVDRVADAIAVIQSEPLDLVLADVKLTDGDGIAVAAAAQERGVPVLFVSGHCPVKARKLAVGCLAKPYTQRDLLRAIAAVEEHLAGKSPKRLPPGLSLYENIPN